MKYFTLILFTFIFKSQVYSQNKDSITTSINQYLVSIDSNKTLAEKISEGQITYKDSLVGGFEIYKLYSSDSKTLFRIQENTSTDTLVKKTIYFKDNKPVYAKIEHSIWKFEKPNIILSQKLYFSNGITSEW